MKDKVIAFLEAENWEASQAYLKAHQADLFTYVADQILAEMQKAAANPADRQVIAAHRALIDQAQKIGIEAAYAELLQTLRANPDLPLLPVGLVDALRHLRTLAPARMSAYLDSKPELREQLVELGLLQVRQSMEGVILAFLNADNWADKRRLLEQNPKVLFSAGAVAWFEESLRKSLGHPTNTLVLEAHQRLLTRCQEIGIAEAFAEAESALKSTLD